MREWRSSLYQGVLYLCVPDQITDEDLIDIEDLFALILRTLRRGQDAKPAEDSLRKLPASMPIPADGPKDP